MGDGPGGLFCQSQYSELACCCTVPEVLHCGLPTVFSDGKVDDQEGDAPKQQDGGQVDGDCCCSQWKHAGCGVLWDERNGMRLGWG